MATRIIAVPPGIGDIAWVIQKLINTGEKFIFRIPGALPQRGKSILDLLPSVAERAFYDGGLRFRHVKMNNHAVETTDDFRTAVFRKVPYENFPNLPRKNWRSILTYDIYLEANTFLESGMRIETFLPDLPPSYTLPFETSDNQKTIAGEFVKGKSIGIYCASYGGSQNWGTWMIPEWLQLVELLTHYKATFVIIGASYDDLTNDLFWKIKEKGIPVVNTVGADLGTTIEVLKRLDYFIGFPSGLSILNEMLGKDGIMFYSKQIQKIIGTWANPERIKNKNIKECVFSSPLEIYYWIKQNHPL